MASSNPAFNEKIFQKEIDARRGSGFSPGWGSPADEVPSGLFDGGATTTAGRQETYAPSPVTGAGGDTMRVGGTLSAATVLLGLVLVGGWFGWQAVTVTETVDPVTQQTVATASLPGWLIPMVLGALVVAVLTAFKPKLARITAPIYSLAQGSAVGAISHYFDAQYDGIVIQAVGLTIGVFVMMLVLSQRFGQLVADGEDRVQGRHRLLEDRRDLLAPDRPHLAVGQRSEVTAVEADVPISDVGLARGQESRDRHRGHALARSRLADKADHLTAGYGQIEFADWRDGATRGVDPDREVLDG
ncbi:MAG: Bax inhibitor-1/YccA family protein [Aquihabitans sp.]